MTQRVAALLDEAMSTLEPGNPDPVAAVLARGRAARRRTLGTGVLAVAVLIGAGVAVGTQVGEDEPPPLVSEVAEPPMPQQVGDTVVAGGLILPVPKGWRVARAGLVPGNCATGTMLDNTILIVAPGEGGCVFASIEVRGTKEVNPGGDLASGLPGRDDPIVASPRTYTVRGGEPAWLARGVDDEMNSPARPPGFRYYNTLLLPWSRVSVTFRVAGPDQQRIIDSMRTAPDRGTTRLVLPGTVTKANLTVPDATGRYQPSGYGKSTAPATVGAVLDLLRAQKSVVDNAHACASAGQRAARLTLYAAQPVAPSASPTGARSTLPALNPTTTVIISLGGGCQEAVSSDGGRVRLRDAAVNKLKRLFGIAG
jgi:hypothetical protein